MGSCYESHYDLIQTPRSRFKENLAAPRFSTYFSVFRYLMKHTFSCLIYIMKAEVQRWRSGKHSPRINLPTTNALLAS